MVNKILNIVTYGVIVFVSLIFGGVVSYSFINRSGHTGFNPYLVLSVFIPTLIWGVFYLIFYGFQKEPKSLSGWPGSICIMVAALGILLLIYLDRSNTLLEYQTWIRRGMP